MNPNKLPKRSIRQKDGLPSWVLRRGESGGSVQPPCPKCGYAKGCVIDTRLCVSMAGLKRRRHCFNCNVRFTTYECTHYDEPTQEFKDQGAEI